MTYYINKEKIIKDLWLENLHLVKNYIDQNEKRPTDEFNNLGTWIKTQKKNYKRKQDIFTDTNIRKIWENFLTEYKDYFKTDIEIWKEELEKLKIYITQNGKIPTRKTNNKNIINLASWYSLQILKYKRNKGIMKKKEVKKLWEDFNIEYKNYLKTESDIILEKLDNIKKFVQKSKQVPNKLQLFEYIKNEFEIEN